MGEHLVGIMWNKNEGDILAQTIEAALPVVDSLFIADDGSDDDSWQIILDYAARYPAKIEHIQRNPNQFDQGQRQSMLNRIKERYKPENTWVQVIESDIMVLDTDVKEAVKKYASKDIIMSWHCLNAVRPSWEDKDTWPHWDEPVTELLPNGHWMEIMTYTFRPLPKVRYTQKSWRPWPQGFSHYAFGEPLENRRKYNNSPLIAHYGFRGPTHYYEKFKHKGWKFHKKYQDWDMRSPEAIHRTVPFFNGVWNTGKDVFPMSRAGWHIWRREVRGLPVRGKGVQVEDGDDN
jgi:glycosyltransferase involved in cell wall biosynthesis